MVSTRSGPIRKCQHWIRYYLKWTLWCHTPKKGRYQFKPYHTWKRVARNITFPNTLCSPSTVKNLLCYEFKSETSCFQQYKKKGKTPYGVEGCVRRKWCWSARANELSSACFLSRARLPLVLVARPLLAIRSSKKTFAKIVQLTKLIS